MFRTLGRLDIVCPAHRDGECEARRVACPYSHDLERVKRRRVETGGHGEGAGEGAKQAVPAAKAAGPPAGPKPAPTPPPGAPAAPRPTAHPPTSAIPPPTRQRTLTAIHKALCAAYAPLDGALAPLRAEFAARDARAIEDDVFRNASASTYRSSCVTALLSVQKRSGAALARAAAEARDAAGGVPDGARAVLAACTETGSVGDVLAKRERAAARAANYLSRERLVRAGFLCPKGDLAAMGYIVEVPREWGAGGERRDGTGERHACARCGTSFVVGAAAAAAAAGAAPACVFHPGRLRREPRPGFQRGKELRWTCCGRAAESGALADDRCAAGPHVFKEDDARALHAREGFVTLADISEAPPLLDVAALDCEMSYTTGGLSVTRVTLTDETGAVVLDELVRPRGVAILDFNTQFSGIQADEFEARAVLDLAGVRRALARFIGPTTVLVGHGLENDLRALRLVHTSVVDTCQLFPHPRGLPFRLALRDLVAQHLGRIIQAGSSAVGHSSAEDAQMTLELVRHRWSETHR